MMQSRIQPTLSRMARNASQSAHPELWRGLVGAWVPALGVGPGGGVTDVSANRFPATLSSTSAWSCSSVGRSITFSNSVSMATAATTKLDTSTEWSFFSWFAELSTATTYRNLAHKGQYGAGFSIASWGAAQLYFASFYANAGADTASIFPTAATNFNLGVFSTQAVTYRNRIVNLYAQGRSFGGGSLGFDCGNGSYAMIFGGKGDLQIAANYYFKRELSLREYALLHADPIAPFRLRERRHGFVSLAGIVPWWAGRSNPVIGGGYA